MFACAVNVNLSNPITCLNRYFSLVRMSISLDRFHCIKEKSRKLILNKACQRAKTQVKVHQMSIEVKHTHLLYILLFFFQTITMLTLIILYRNDPLLQLPPGVFSPFPVQKFVSFPTGVPGKCRMRMSFLWNRQDNDMDGFGKQSQDVLLSVRTL